MAVVAAARHSRDVLPLRSARHLSSRTPESWPIQFVFLWHDVLAYCSTPDGPISIPIEVLDS